MTEVYYIEDDKNIAYAVKAYLQSKNCVVSVFSTIAEAKNVLQKQVPGIVLVDWNMPDGQGDMLCQWIRSKWKELPVILLTVRDDAHDIVADFQRGADDCFLRRGRN